MQLEGNLPKGFRVNLRVLSENLRGHKLYVSGERFAISDGRNKRSQILEGAVYRDVTWGRDWRIEGDTRLIVDGHFIDVSEALKKSRSLWDKLTFKKVELEEWSTEDFLQACIEIIRIDGFHSGAYGGRSTAYIAAQNIRDGWTPRSTDEARQMMERSSSSNNSFVRDTVNSLSYDKTNFVTMGYVAHAPLLEKKLQSNWVGEKKERIEVDVTLLSRGDVYVFITDDGDILNWNTNTPFDAKPGDKMRIKATVKEHKKWYYKSTRILRVSR